MNLAEYQRQMMAALLQSPESSMQANEGSSQLRMNIYRNNITGARLQALQQCFPCCERLLGEEYFTQFAIEFMAEHPSQAVQIDACAPQFIDAIRQNENLLQQVPYIADMATLDYAWQLAFHGPNNMAIDYAALGQAAAEQGETLCLQKISGLQLISSSFPLESMWQMCQPEYQGDFVFDSDRKDGHFAIFQREHAIYIESLAPIVFDIVDLLREPLSLEALTDGGPAFQPELLASLYQRSLVQLAS
jgi:hypothetical protein